MKSKNSGFNDGLMYDLCLLSECLFAAADRGEQRVCSTLGHLTLDSTGLCGMAVSCNNHTEKKSENNLNVVCNSSN